MINMPAKPQDYQPIKKLRKLTKLKQGKLMKVKQRKLMKLKLLNDNLDTEVPANSHLNDAGQFTEHHSYSPARPAPSKHSMITTTPGVLSKLKQPKLNYKPVQQSVKSKMDFQ